MDAPLIGLSVSERIRVRDGLDSFANLVREGETCRLTLTYQAQAGVTWVVDDPHATDVRDEPTPEESQRIGRDVGDADAPPAGRVLSPADQVREAVRWTQACIGNKPTGSNTVDACNREVVIRLCDMVDRYLGGKLKPIVDEIPF